MSSFLTFAGGRVMKNGLHCCARAHCVVPRVAMNVFGLGNFPALPDGGGALAL